MMRSASSDGVVFKLPPDISVINSGVTVTVTVVAALVVVMVVMTTMTMINS